LAYVYPTVNDFKNYFIRDFPYQPSGDPVDLNKYIQDVDIEKAQGEADFNFNQGFASSQANFSILFNYLTAHFLCIDMRNASQGIQGKYEWVQTSKSVGSVSVGMQVPQRILDNPELAMLTQTTYGGKYLQLVLPQLSGQVFSVCGGTRP
jgi:hypothetical protein